MWSCDQSMVNLSISVTEVKFNEDLTRKTTSWFKLNNLGLVLGTNLKFYTSAAKGFKLKVRKFWGLIPTFAEATEEKLVGEPFCPSPSPNPDDTG